MATDHFDVMIVGAGLSGIGAAYHLQTQLPQARATPFWRAATPSAAHGICSAIPASAPIPTCTRWATPSSRGEKPRPSPTGHRSANMCARRRAKTASTKHIRFHHQVKRASWSSDDSALDGGSRSAGRKARSSASPAISFSCAAAITITRAATRRNSKAPKISRARSSIRRNGRKISTIRARTSS